MTLDDIHISELANGIRMLCIGMPGADVEYFGVAVNAGSRDERDDEHGMAHFVEHTIFKGSSTRSSRSIINHMESVGGELNAYTTKEETLVYSVFPRGYLGRAVPLIFDLVTDSVFPADELDREREVVCDEINSYLDIPAESVYDCFEEELFAGSSLSHNILGTVESVRMLDSDKCRRWLDRYYRPDNMVVFYCGADVGRAHRSIARYFGQIEASRTDIQRVEPCVNDTFDTVRTIGSHQSHTIIGARIPGMYDSGRHAMALVNNILGGPGMNSRLNVELRERRGLVYSVDSSVTHYTDAGVFSIYYGCDPEDAGRCHRLVMRQLERMASERMSDTALRRAQRQYVGQMTVAAAQTESMVLSMTRGVMYHRRPMSITESARRIMALTPDDVREAAARIAPALCSKLTFG